MRLALLVYSKKIIQLQKTDPTYLIYGIRSATVATLITNLTTILSQTTSSFSGQQA